MGNPYPHVAFMADAGFSNVEVLDSPRPQKLHLYLPAPTTDSVAHMSKSLKSATGLSRCTYCSSSRQSAWPVFSPSFTTRSDGGHDAVARGGSIVAGGDLPQLSLRATVSIRLQGDRDSTMSGSVEATTAIVLKRMSSGTPASRMAATRWLATAARSSWLIPRPA